MSHEQWMQIAIKQAKLAEEKGEVPIGAALVMNNRLVSQQYNKTITLSDPTAHAEILCIRDTAKKIHNHRLTDAILYVTLEPCIMCYGAIAQARINHVILGASDSRSGVCLSPDLSKKLKLNHHPSFTSGILKSECENILKSFFKKKRT